MRNPIIFSAVALLAGLTAGFPAGRMLSASRPGSEVALRDSTEVASEVKESVLPSPTAPKDPRDARMIDRIKKERNLLTTPFSDYPKLIRAELEQAENPDDIYRIFQVWAEKDPAGFIAWGKRQPSFLRLNNAEFSVSVADRVLNTAIRHFPDEAWELAEKTPGIPGQHRWTILTSTLLKDSAAAVELVRKHRDFFSASSQAYGVWFNMDPMKALPLLDEFTPGKARADLAKQSARYYEDNPGEAGAAAAWFQKLPPDLQTVVAKKATDGQFYQVSPEHLATLRRIWKVESPPPAEEQ